MAVRLTKLPPGAVVLEERPAPASIDAGSPDLEDQLGLQLQMMADQHGIAAAIREYRFLGARGLAYRADYAFPHAPSGRKVLVEMEGGTRSHANAGAHMRPERYERDCVKYSFAALDGWTVIRATPAMVEDGRALLLVESAVLGVDHMAAVQQRTREVAPRRRKRTP